MTKYIRLLLDALRGSETNFTSGSINRAIFLLSVPMILEMVMESLFAVVDVFFVAKIGTQAIATVGLTESVLTIVYSIAIGLSTAATAMVSRRVGEDNRRGAAQAVGQVILVSLVMAVLMGVPGFIFAEGILRLMGGDEQLIANGANFTRMIFASSPAIMLLYTLSGCLRGAGDASMAMRSLWIANGFNIILCPVLIFGWGPFPELGVMGSAVATTVGRSLGVLYQLYALTRQKGGIQVLRSDLTPDMEVIRNIISLAIGGTSQFLVGSASWIFLTRILSTYGSDVVAGYTIAIRIIIFTILPSWGMANAAATLVGQNLGAGQPERAETSAWRAAFCNMIFLATVGVGFFLGAAEVVSLFDNNTNVVDIAVQCLRVFCLGYLFMAYGMVLSQSLNGAGDTRTPTIINIVCFWLIEIPLAYTLAHVFNWGPPGVFWSVAISETLLAVIAILVFRRGRWKTVQV
ncbi:MULTISPECIES: MATE family efflux transporter [unclassified Spirosoma]|uniref:MATE family efflux transporter n=1 Tax=unclassified Spirosoma TaxID=2621999 RepID=UPI0009596224|nr:MULTISPECIES: MATE family efflux transporter [unclassified Spirosoma]MBN8825957.1 MATE family efflux transporter [Spirosoma sp.]OJW70989.1 MAG: MATE family efflux transporter [Spirosoma sp. 48-14]